MPAVFADSSGAISTAALISPAVQAQRSVERRHLTVLFCDLVDSTRLSGRVDPEDWHEAMGLFRAAARSAITRYSGYLAQFQGDYFENKRITAEAYYGLTSADFAGLAGRFGAGYLVVEKPHAYAFPVVYENAKFVIYDLP